MSPLFAGWMRCVRSVIVVHWRWAVTFCMTLWSTRRTRTRVRTQWLVLVLVVLYIISPKNLFFMLAYVHWGICVHACMHACMGACQLRTRTAFVFICYVVLYLFILMYNVNYILMIVCVYTMTVCASTAYLWMGWLWIYGAFQIFLITRTYV